ncbi:hypothetical protein MHUMG1_02460 [Metarhizium humberi]|uniref:Armadillo-like helical domain-containing protein n=1 Tax=Metarhizium humberi TaxID=2596975 RepID=A0A9P8MF89_9HYPO|nr:hypothetical protein MHUMG1_02460 [Metarhizium humberi]
MEASPLTRQPPPERLCQEDDDTEEKSDGFWAEFFLLRPDRQSLRALLNDMSPADVLTYEGRTRELFGKATVTVKTGQGLAPLHALDTLGIFLSCLLSKKYPHPSSDIIAILAGLDHIDAVFTDFFVQDSETPGQVLEPFILLGLLANYNKFEFQNPYQLRFNDFVNEETIQKTIRCIGYTCQALRLDYIDVQDDLPEGWTFSNTLNLIGFGLIIRGSKPEKKPVYDAETAKQLFSNLPGESAAALLASYDFAHANKLFCFNFVSLPGENDGERPIASYLSLTSYLLQHAHLSHRATYYAHLNLMRRSKSFCSTVSTSATVLAAYHVVNLLALSLSAGEAFLPTPAAYDDLFYKVVESGEVLTKFKENYGLENRKSNSIDTLISVSTHYNQLLAGGAGSSKKKPSHLTTHQVTEVIKQGYETLSIQAKEGLDTWGNFREADERTLLKKMARASVGDVRVMVERHTQ